MVAVSCAWELHISLLTPHFVEGRYPAKQSIIFSQTLAFILSEESTWSFHKKFYPWFCSNLIERKLLFVLFNRRLSEIISRECKLYWDMSEDFRLFPWVEILLSGSRNRQIYIDLYTLHFWSASVAFLEKAGRRNSASPPSFLVLFLTVPRQRGPSLWFFFKIYRCCNIKHWQQKVKASHLYTSWILSFWILKL